MSAPIEPPPARRSARALPAYLAAAALLLSACTPPGGNTTVPGSDPGPTEAPKATPAAFAEVDDALLGDIAAGELADSAAGVDKVVVPSSESARNLSLAIELATSKGLRNNAVAGGTNYTQEWRAIGSSPKAVGVLLDTSASADGNTRTVPITVWYDAATKRGVATPGLIGLDDWRTFVDAVTAALPSGSDEEKATEALSQQAAPYGNGPSMGFDADGNAVIGFSSDIAAELVIVPRAQIQPILSPFGVDAQESATNPEAFDPKAKVEARDRKTTVGGENEKAGASPSPEPTRVEIPDGPGGSGNEGEPSEEPTPIERPYPWIGVNCKLLKCVALTYDDGPGPRTKEVVDAYTAQGQAISFFVLGQKLVDDEAATRYAAARGMEINSHTWTHNTRLPSVADEDSEREIGDTAKLIAKVAGRPPLFMRPPGGNSSANLRANVKRYGQALVNWKVDTEDWKTMDATSTENSASTAKPGEVVLMHDIHDPTVDAAVPTAEDMAENGKTAVTVGELSDYGWEAGEMYPKDGYPGCFSSKC